MDAWQTPPPTPLLAALWAGDVSTDRALVAAGADPTVADTRDIGQSWTPLHFAADAGDTELVRALLAAGAAVDARSVAGQTYLISPSAVAPVEGPDRCRPSVASG
jgi:ankyrin repeat protein